MVWGTGNSGEGGRGAVSAVSEAFRWSGANLLPFTKFIANGLFTK